MKISIIIPTLNEENCLPKLLDSIKLQDFDDYEIIIADAHSTDKTREIAEGYGCRVVDGGRPSAGRNAGAGIAKGELLLFFDADVILPQGFIRNLYNEMMDRFIDLATCEIRPLSEYQLDRVIHKVINLTILFNLWIDPKAFGFCIFVTKRLFNRVNGFDETIYVVEDNDFVKRASAFRALRYLNSVHLWINIRRFEKEGRFAYLKKGIKMNLYRAFVGEIRNSEFVKYEFDAFDKVDNEKSRDFLDKIEKKLLEMEENSIKLNIEAKALKKKDFMVNTEKLQPYIDEYKHLIEELDVYLSRKDKREKKRKKPGIRLRVLKKNDRLFYAYAC